jgi:NADH pyrophosphatase NudC (nudix superfamily)
LLVVLIVMIGMTVGYKYKLKKDRIARIRRAQEIRMQKEAQGTTTTDGVSLSGTSLQATDRVESQQTGPSAVQLARMQRVAPLCFACGTKTRPDERGRFVCPKCGSTSK